MEIEGEGSEEKIKLLNDVDVVADHLTDCFDEWKRTAKDQPHRRLDTLRILDLLEPEMMELSLEFGRDLTHDVRLFVGKAREMLTQPLHEWEEDWGELIAECEEIEREIHKKK